jgi:hypothetical protein
MQDTEFLPFTRPFIDEDTINAVGEVLRSGWLSSGANVLAFENALSSYLGGRFVRVVNSGSAALQLALQVCGIGPGDEVITTPLSWVATANVILINGATPVFVDVDTNTRNIDLSLLESFITVNTRAIIPVDLAGLSVDRDKLYKIANKYQLRVIEDAAQSLGSSWNKQPIGSFGDLVAFSFHANKNVTTGEGGCLVMSNTDEVQLFEKLRLHGTTRLANGLIDCEALGGKFNLTDIAATIGLGQLAQLETFTKRRGELAKLYFKNFNESLGCILPLANFEQTNWHMFQIVLPPNITQSARENFVGGMRKQGIGIGIHYPAIHQLTLYNMKGYRAGSCPIAEAIADRIVTLPLFPTMQDSDVIRVCKAITSVLEPMLSNT